VSKANEIYDAADGALRENVDAETATRDLVELNESLQWTASAAGVRVAEGGDDEERLNSLCKSCNAIAEELLAKLEELKVKKGERTKWTSFKKALRGVWSKDDIDRLEKRLSKLREEINLHVVINLRFVQRFDTIPLLRHRLD
jgi:hypothetical protein